MPAGRQPPSSHQALKVRSTGLISTTDPSCALQLNGIALGWTVDYGLQDWSVPAGVFAHQGSYISALATLAKAGSAYLIPHPSNASFKVRPCTRQHPGTGLMSFQTLCCPLPASAGSQLHGQTNPTTTGCLSVARSKVCWAKSRARGLQATAARVKVVVA